MLPINFANILGVVLRALSLQRPLVPCIFEAMIEDGRLDINSGGRTDKI